MIPLVTADDIREWVPAQPEHESFLWTLAGLSTGIVLDYVGPDPITHAPRTWTEATVPDPVRAAILMVTTEMFANRGDEATSSGLIERPSLGELSPYIGRLLQRFKEPVMS